MVSPHYQMTEGLLWPVVSAIDGVLERLFYVVLVNRRVETFPRESSTKGYPNGYLFPLPCGAFPLTYAAAS